MINTNIIWGNTMFTGPFFLFLFSSILKTRLDCLLRSKFITLNQQGVHALKISWTPLFYILPSRVRWEYLTSFVSLFFSRCLLKVARTVANLRDKHCTTTRLPQTVKLFRPILVRPLRCWVFCSPHVFCFYSLLRAFYATTTATTAWIREFYLTHLPTSTFARCISARRRRRERFRKPHSPPAPSHRGTFGHVW